MDFFRFIQAFFRFFLPPKSSEAEPLQLTWRYKVASTLATLTVAIILICLLSTGQFPAISQGFASVETETQQHAVINQKIEDQKKATEAIGKDLADMRRDQLDTRLYDMRGRQCAAMVTKNEAALRSEGRRLEENLPKYRELAREDWRIPPCDEY